ncbi:hypothetical protein [Microbacterium sp. NIBRBAC000506063]|uniref:hypothetical protein n=1 Tax=Microbacterium sp. NIBRBAC000506063 TaxID=2734618 RepID=UPI002948C0DC|nr:hypothetical protein [Microbacterium sp. NIBRBAC000506063]
MDSTTAITNRSRARWLVAIFGALLCSFFLLAGAPPAFAEEAPVDLVEEETGGEEIGEEHPYQFRGIVRYEGEPLEGVRITVEGGGYFAEAITNEEGRWSVGVPSASPTPSPSTRTPSPRASSSRTAHRWNASSGRRTPRT